MITRNGPLRLASGALIVLGTVLVVNPELVRNGPIPDDPFEAIERRIWWGAIIAAGVLLLFRSTLRPVLQSVAAASAALLFGLLVARLIGIALDGSVAKQWVYVAIEAVLLAAAVQWFGRLRRQTPEGG
ncbi:MAG: hypothetical protein AAF460_04170 [Pseudomonadota bacterium]